MLKTKRSGTRLPPQYCQCFLDLITFLFDDIKQFFGSIEAKIIIEQWRREYNQVRPHSSLRYRPPAPEAKLSLTLT
ncbi:MAG: integrase core domain-containing protein [Dehalococcoidales bacterium]|nr:integrase core domain-containing protein [Dehalococcoidales bacterium]